MGSSGGGGSGNATQIQGVTVSGSAPSLNNVLTYNGSSWAPAAPAAAFVPDVISRPTAALAETFPRPLATSAVGLSSQSLQMTAISIPTGTTIGHIAFMTAGTGLSGQAHWWFGLYDNNLVQLAVTADQLTAAWSSATIKSIAIATIASGASSTFTTTYTGVHYLGVLVSGSAPSMVGTAAFNATAGGIAPAFAGSSDTGQTTPPAFPHTATALTAFDGLYAYVAA